MNDFDPEKRLIIGDLCGIPVHDAGSEDLYTAIDTAIRRGKKRLILNVNIHCAVLAWRQPWLFSFLNEGHLVFCDGDGVRWGLKILGEPVPPKVPFTRWIWTLSDFCASRGYKIYLIGGRPGVAEKARDNLLKSYPDLKVAGVHHGYFEKEGEGTEAMIKTINGLKPDLLIVAFGMPCQERWLKENWERLDALVMMPAGGVLDYAAGCLGKAPDWMVRLSLEWLFRVYEEPGRLAKRYATEIPFFFWRVFCEKIRRTLISRRFRKGRPESSSEKS